MRDKTRGHQRTTTKHFMRGLLAAFTCVTKIPLFHPWCIAPLVHVCAVFSAFRLPSPPHRQATFTNVTAVQTAGDTGAANAVAEVDHWPAAAYVNQLYDSCKVRHGTCTAACCCSHSWPC